ncbi:hypothetical protein B0H17DRAFT_1086436 [Mycena rosella]|uniref:Integrase core domain-containing protein n=1 Tax=Mycena rosella TaxID=1033263 RepID=A0AAD7CZK4_MYCRO|nr:hypothetical protein B0H17DRAFT_1086436 [Mycena rosella]
MERLLIQHWGVDHCAYLRGRSLHNVRIERLWRDVRKDSLESYRQIFTYLGNTGLLDMENEIHRSCLFLVFQPRIQASLDRTRDAWNHHKAPLPPITEQHGEPEIVSQEPVGIDAEREAGICVNDDDELREVQELMPDFDFGRNDENWGIDVYCEAVLLLKSRM